MWKYIATQRQGRSHVKANIPVQDKTYIYLDAKSYVISLADGAGSAKLSHYGADGIIRAISHYLSEQFEQDFSEEKGVLVKQRIV